MGGLSVDGVCRAVRLILNGDYAFMTSWVGKMGASSCRPCLWCTALRRRTLGNGLLVDKWGDMQVGSRAQGVARTRAHFKRMPAEYAECENGALATLLTLDQHFSMESRPLLIIDPSHISPMPLHHTLGITGALLRLGIESVYFHHGPARARAYSLALSLALRWTVRVLPKPYFGGVFEGRQCQLIARRLSAVTTLLAANTTEAEGEAYRAACDTWVELLPVLTRVRNSSAADASAFRAGTARFVDGLCAAFPWFSVTLMLHALCCHTPDFLTFFGSLGRYSEQGLEAWHGHCNKTVVTHPADTFLGSSLSYVKRSLISRAPGNVAYNCGAKRSPAKAGPAVRDARRSDDKRTRTGKILAGAPGASASCLQKQGEDGNKWAEDNLAAAAIKIDAHWKRTKERPPESFLPQDDETWDGEGDYGELLEVETTCMLALREE